MTSLMPVASYQFENIVAGKVNDSSGTHHGTVNQASIDTIHYSEGLASLAFGGNSSVQIPDNEALRGVYGFAIGMWARPTTLGAAKLVQKTGEYEISVDSDGRVSATVWTSDGEFTSTSTKPLALWKWNYISVQQKGMRLAVTVDGVTEYTAMSGSMLQTTNHVVIGTGFTGNIDSLAIYKDNAGGAGFVQLTGVDSSGQVQLDETGHAQLTVQSTGNLVTSSFGQEIGVHIVASPENEEEVKVVSKTMYTHAYNLGRGFVWGDGEGAAGIAGDFAAGMCFGIGDARDIIKNLAYIVPGGNDPDWTQFGFAVVGLATEFVPIAGEAPDAVVTSVKVILPRIGHGVFRNTLTKLPKEMFDIAVKQGLTAAKDFALNYAGFLKKIITGGDETLQAFNTVIKSEKTLEKALKLHKILGDEAVDILVAIKSSVGPEAVEKVIHTLAEGVDDAILAGIKNSGMMNEALTGLAKIIKNSNINPEDIKRVLGNSHVFSPSYGHAKLLSDLGEVAGTPGLFQLVDALKAANQGVHGVRYELEVAVHLKNQGNQINFINALTKDASLGKTDIDIVAGGILYQVKSTYKSFISLRETEVWVQKALKTSDGIASKIKYAVPGLDTVPPKIKKYLDDMGILIETVPHPYP